MCTCTHTQTDRQDRQTDRESRSSAVEGTEEEDESGGVDLTLMEKGNIETVVSKGGKMQRALFPVWVRGNEPVSE